MKIYSKFKDYYDSALGSFLESDVVFRRNPELIFLNHKEHRELGDDFDGKVTSYESFFRDNQNAFKGKIDQSFKYHIHLYSFWIAFCGKYYPFVTPSGTIGEVVCGEFIKNSASDLYDKILHENSRITADPISFEDLRKYSSFTLDFNRHIGIKSSIDEEFRDPNLCEYWKEQAFRDFGPVFMMLYPVIPVMSGDSGSKPITIIKNVKLSTFGFHRVKDPYTALWEVESWLDSNARPDDAVVPVGDDLTRLKAYGFDPKTSFRKCKSKRR